ncbi:MAG: head-tail connector protein [Rhizobiaceae bacterium]|nr:head-tail connector protein [Rhizobiaceae bacterium]
MTHALITPPEAEPITLGEFKAHLRIDDGDEDALLADLARAARDHLERMTGLALINQGWRLFLDDWPESGTIDLVRGPVTAIDAVRFYDEAGEAVEMPLAGHVLDGARRPARLWIRGRPDPRRAINGIEVDFTAGFGESGADVPDTLRRALLLHAAHMYEFRGAVPVELQPASIPEGYDRLVAPFRMRRL